jgi:hypothetical protein
MLDLRAGPARRLDAAAFLAMMRTTRMNIVSDANIRLGASFPAGDGLRPLPVALSRIIMLPGTPSP